MCLLSVCLHVFIFTLLLGDFSVKTSIKACVCTKRNLYLELFQKITTCTISYDLLSNFPSWRLAKQLHLERFPLDPEKKNYVREVKDCVFSVVNPIPFKTKVQLVAHSVKVLNQILDLDAKVLDQTEFISFVSGGHVLKGTTPLSHRYGGHQFGSWADQLGDGRAVMIGEYVNKKGKRWELQLKGSGLTPYSRRGDGRAVLRSSIREFLCSEAMYHLGIPTSRAATITVSDDPVIRDQFYDGHPMKERGAIVLRLARSWFRIGSLEILAKKGEIELLKTLTDFVIENYFTAIDINDKDKYLAFYSKVVKETEEMTAKWQSVGFTHGVCNTDNFSLLSITIDYGPFGFLEEYNPDFVPNTSDDEGMYSYKKQPEIGIFNLDKLAQALVPLLESNQIQQIEIILKGYVQIYKQKYMEIFRRKLGFVTVEEDDEQLVAILLKMMEERKSDFTMTFRQMGELSLKNLESKNIPKSAWALKRLSSHDWYNRWIKAYRQRQQRQNISDERRQNIMNNTNPRYVLRNWIAQKVIEQAENNDFEGVRKVLKILENPFTLQKEAEENGYASPPPYWAKLLKVSCSS